MRGVEGVLRGDPRRGSLLAGAVGLSAMAASDVPIALRLERF
ncbi:MAG: hypothetical protein U0075_10115 [Thermomicrobiales bacterium]